MLGGALLAAGVTLGVAPAASAHNALRSTNPAGGSTVATLPATVVLTFDEPSETLGTQVVVLGPTGDVATRPPRLIDDDVRQAVTPGSPAGLYTVNWRVTSADGHPVQGTFSFTTSAKAAGTAPTASAAASPLAAGQHAADTGTRTSHGAALSAGAAAVLVAGAAFTVVARRRRRHR